MILYVIKILARKTLDENISNPLYYFTDGSLCHLCKSISGGCGTHTIMFGGKSIVRTVVSLIGTVSAYEDLVVCVCFKLGVPCDCEIHIVHNT